LHAAGIEVRAKRTFIEWRDLDREMIQVAAFLAGRGTAFQAERFIDRDQVDQRIACTNLIQTQRVLLLFHRAPESVYIET